MPTLLSPVELEEKVKAIIADGTLYSVRQIETSLSSQHVEFRKADLRDAIWNMVGTRTVTITPDRLIRATS